MNKYDEAITKALPGMVIKSVYDYPSVFVYEMVANRFKDEKSKKPLNSQFSIDKKTMYIEPFFPFKMSIDSYKKGKKIR